jgi:hypothetical protein
MAVDLPKVQNGFPFEQMLRITPRNDETTPALGFLKSHLATFQ